MQRVLRCGVRLARAVRERGERVQTFVTEPVDWPDTAPALREQVRALVAEHGERDPVRRANSWTKAAPQFSRKLGEAGLLVPNARRTAFIRCLKHAIVCRCPRLRE